MRVDLPSLRASHVWGRDFRVFRKYFVSSILPSFVEPLLYIIALGYGLGFFVGEIQGIPYQQFLAPGILSYSSMFAASSECTYSTFVRMIYQKTYDAVLVTPVNVEDIVLGEILWGATKAVISGICIFIVIMLLGLVRPESFFVIVPTVVVVGLVFASLGMFFTSIVPTIDSFNYYFTLVISPMFLLSGVFFPLSGSNLPAIVPVIAWFMPLTHAGNVIRPAALGQYSWSFAGDIIWMAVFALVFYAISTVLMKRRLIQ
jgi:lipooligosaccharide transport system permease protein